MDRSLKSYKRSKFLSAPARLVPLIGAALLVLSILTATRALAAVNVTSYSARFQGNQVLVEWETANELNNLGFNILRSMSSNGPYSKIAGLIPSQAPGTFTGARYSYTDGNVTVGQTYFYKLQAVERSGSIQEFGPFSTNPASGIATRTATKTTTVVPTTAVTATATRVSTATNTPIKTTTRTPTTTGTLPPTATPTPLGTPPPTQIAMNPKLPAGDSQSGKVPAATPQVDPQSGNQVPQVTLLPSPAADAAEEFTGEAATGDPGQESIPSGASLRPVVSVLFFGLAVIFGLGSIVFGALGVVLFARANLRR